MFVDLSNKGNYSKSLWFLISEFVSRGVNSTSSLFFLINFDIIIYTCLFSRRVFTNLYGLIIQYTRGLYYIQLATLYSYHVYTLESNTSVILFSFTLGWELRQQFRSQGEWKLEQRVHLNQHWATPGTIYRLSWSLTVTVTISERQSPRYNHQPVKEGMTYKDAKKATMQPHSGLWWYKIKY